MLTMLRRSTVFITVLIVACATASLAVAASVHLKGGAHAKPSFTDLGTQLNVSGALSGLGQQDLTVTLNATANVTATCTNGGMHQAPGQNPAPISVTGSQAIPAGSVINGNVSFNVTTNKPASPIAGAPDCPNPNWSEGITDLSFTSGTIIVRQPDTDGTGPIVFTLKCTFSPATSDGAVPSGNVTC
jgi:hypothetical protein